MFSINLKDISSRRCVCIHVLHLINLWTHSDHKAYNNLVGKRLSFSLCVFRLSVAQRSSDGGAVDAV